MKFCNISKIGGFFLFALSFIVLNETKAQTKAEIFTHQDLPITFLGLDFSQVLYLGDPNTVSPGEMKREINEINLLMIQEPKKYDFQNAFRKNIMESNIGFSEERNNKIDADLLHTYDTKRYKRFNEDSIKKIVSNYQSSGKGVALIFVMETLNKVTEETAMWPTFFNMETKEIIFTERVIGKAKGFGFRNHWAGSVYDVLRKIDDTLFKDWKKKFGVPVLKKS